MNLNCGQIWKNKAVVNRIYPLKVGCIFRMSIDLVANNMQFFEKFKMYDNFLVSEVLPVQLTDRKVFFFISLLDQWDAIRLITP